MIKVIKMGVSGISKKLWLSIFLLMEVVVIVVAANIIVCNMNSKSALYEPFKYLLEGQGVIFTGDPVIEDDEGDGTKIFKKVEKKLKGDFTAHRFYKRQSLLKLNANRSLYVDVLGFETEFYKNMYIPLSEGSWSLTSEEGNYVECVVSPNNLGVGVGSIFTEKANEYGEVVTYKVVGVLSNPTYRPVDDFAADSCDTFFNSYDKNDYTVDDPQVFMYVNGRKLSQYSGTHVASGEFLMYDKVVGPDVIKYNNTVLGRKGYYYSTEEFKENSEEYVERMQKRMMPVFVGGMFVVMVGIISASMIQTMSQMRQFGVFYLCGASRAKCILISIIGNLLTYMISIVVALCCMITLYNTSLRTGIGMIFRMNNIWITLVIVALLVLMSVIVPFIMLRMSSIKNILIKNEE